jgi:hypothetical protein
MTQYYIGCKQVEAWEQESETGHPGYAVKYPDGYISWSPKETFEAAYLPMGEGNDGSRVTQEMVNNFVSYIESARMANHTVVCGRLVNGFTVIEESACVDAKNYDHDIGFKYACQKVESRAWHLLGFLLACARNGFK